MPALPTSLALTSIADSSLIIASDHRNNYAAVQTAMNALITALSGGNAGQVLQASSSTAVQWATAGGLYRKTTAKTVNTTVAATDLLNAEVTIGAGVLGTTGALRLTANGDYLQNAAATAAPRFQLVLGGTTLLDTGAPTITALSNASRFGWRIVCEIANLGAANSQWATIDARVGVYTNGTAPPNSVFTTGEGSYSFMGSGGTMNIAQALGGGAGTKDTTGALALALNVILPVSSASCEIVLKHALVEVI